MKRLVGFDVALDKGGSRLAVRSPLAKQRRDHLASLIAESAIGAAVQDEVGQGSVVHLGRIVGEVRAEARAEAGP